MSWSVGDERSLMKAFEQGTVDVFAQEWSANLSLSHMYTYTHTHMQAAHIPAHTSIKFSLKLK